MSETRPSTIARSRQSTASSRAPFAARSTTRRRSGKVVSGRPSPLASRATISAVSRSEVLASSSVSARGRLRLRSAPRADTVRPASASRTASHSSTCLALGGSVQKVYQPHAEAISLEIRSQGKTLTLYFSADPETARLHLLSKKPLNPSTPPPFCLLLRAHLEGARIERIEQVGNDRIVRLVMQRDG